MTDRMDKFSPYMLVVFGLLLLIFGGFSFIDCVLPMRSDGPNPSVVEIVTGLVVGVIGWSMRRAGLGILRRS